MTDIDFDELDKAVNSLMGTVPKDEPDDAPKAKLLNISSTLKPGEKPAYDRLEEVAKKIGSETLVTDGERTIIEELDSSVPTDTPPKDLATPEPAPISVPAAAEPVPTADLPAPIPVPKPVVKRPNSGRFMDVVHSSSDMKSSDFPPLIVPERVTPKPTISSQTPVASNEEKPSETSQSAANFMTPTEVAPIDESASLTPFLPDAKVEKRPLGGAVPSPFADQGAPDSKLENDQTSEGADETSTAATVTNGVEESGSGDVAQDGDAQKALNATDFSSKQTADEEAVRAIEAHETNPAEVGSDPNQGPTPEEHVRAVESADTESLSTGTIGKQYTEETAESAETEDNAIYDVDNYHQPLGHPAKQKSGWGIVIIITLIVIICAGLGAAAYFILGAGV